MNDADFIEILGVKVKLRTVSCAPTAPAYPDDFKLVIHVTDACPAACKFCCNSSVGFSLDVEKFKQDYKEIIKKCHISDVYFTGGEPMLYWKKIKECLSVIGDIRCTVHTTGVNLDQIDMPVNLSISRHHWDHEINERIIGTKFPNTYLDNFPFKERANISCNIIKGFVDNIEDMKRVLDFSMKTGFGFVAFIGLMPLNNYSKEFGREIPTPECVDILKYKEYSYKNSVACRCANYCYHKNGEFLLFYTRHNQCPNENHGGRIVYKNGIQPWFTK